MFPPYISPSFAVATITSYLLFRPQGIADFTGLQIFAGQMMYKKLNVEEKIIGSGAFT
jgi:hypothetical protein